ncbi:hypothetical protein AB0K74_12960 [Streptomyces sp. NPDC056159]|uniref:hypothetical protein n=1 Tax=unclassified Streptomyces TaxID=2593676 RepID=UPI00343D8EDE
MLEYLLLSVAGVLVAGSAVLAVVAIRTGWVLPWLRRRMFRPRLWGYGTLLGDAGLFVSFLTFRVLHSSLIGEVVFFTAMALIISGGVLSFLSSRPGSDVTAGSNPTTSAP